MIFSLISADGIQFDLYDAQTVQARAVLFAAAAVCAEHRAVMGEETSGITKTAFAVLDDGNLTEGLAVIRAFSDDKRRSSPTPARFFLAVIVGDGIIDGVKRVFIVTDDLHRGIGRGKFTRFGQREACQIITRTAFILIRSARAHPHPRNPGRKLDDAGLL